MKGEGRCGNLAEYILRTRLAQIHTLHPENEHHVKRMDILRGSAKIYMCLTGMHTYQHIREKRALQ